MKTDRITPPLHGPAAHVPPPGAGVAIAAMGDEDLEQLRRALARALSDVRLGSSASALLGRLSRQARTEQRRRARRSMPPEAA